MQVTNRYRNVISKSAIQGYVTVDSTSDDNGYLTCGRNISQQGISASLANHSTALEAIANLAAYLNGAALPVEVIIIGHGYEGKIVTGAGQNATSDEDKYIGYDNPLEWKEQLGQLRGKISFLYLFACNAGAGDEGTDLLNQIAEAIQAPVAAPTGFIFCGPNSYILERRTSWKVVTPETVPEPA